MNEKIDTLVVGGGQAGISMSEHLSSYNIPHVVLEKGRIAESWRSARWDSLLANGPAWHDRLPGMKFSDVDPDAFPAKEQVASYLAEYAAKIKAPIRCGVEVKSVEKQHGRLGFIVKTSHGEFDANNVVAATGAFQLPRIPNIVDESSRVFQVHSSAYKNPDQLPAGAVLVVGAGASGAQIADELQRAGRRVYLSVGQHERPPRRYRDRDGAWWSGVLGAWDAPGSSVDADNIPIAVSGVYPDKSIDFREMAQRGVVLVGTTIGLSADRIMMFADDIYINIDRANQNYLGFLRKADEFVEKNGLDLPADFQAYNMLLPTAYEKNPITRLDIDECGVTCIVWATGFSRDYSWIRADALDEMGRPIHHRGVSPEAGIYFLGLPFQSRRSSSFLFGVWYDARYIADRIATRNSYLNFKSSSRK